MNKETVSRVQSAMGRLEALGSADAVARHLKEQGVRGSHGSTQCPLAVHLRPLAPRWVVSVLPEDVFLSRNSSFRLEDAHIGCGPVLYDFVGAFDLGCYPQLEER